MTNDNAVIIISENDNIFSDYCFQQVIFVQYWLQ